MTQPIEPTQTTELDLNAIEAGANAATSGPWTTGADKAWSDALPPWALVIDAAYPLIELQEGPQGAADAEFIARARTDVPALVAEVRRLREQLAQVGIGCNCCFVDGHTRRCGRTATTEVDVAPFGVLAVSETCKQRINGTTPAASA